MFRLHHIFSASMQRQYLSFYMKRKSSLFILKALYQRECQWVCMYETKCFHTYSSPVTYTQQSPLSTTEKFRSFLSERDKGLRSVWLTVRRFVFLLLLSCRVPSTSPTRNSFHLHLLQHNASFIFYSIYYIEGNLNIALTQIL